MQKRVFKKIIALFLAIIMLATSVPTNFYANTDAAETVIKTTTEEVAIESVEAYASNENPVVGEQVQCWVTVTPEDAAYEIVRWYSSDESVATVDQNGLVTTLEARGAVSIYVEE